MHTLPHLFDALRMWRLRKSAQPLGGWRPRHVACWTCQLTHALPREVRQAMASAEGFFARHEGHQVDWCEQRGLAGLWHANADVKLAYQAAQTFTVTNLHSLASSTTAGWQGAVVDNTANLYLDALLMTVFDFANTAPANSKGCYLFAYAGLESGTYTNPCSGSEGTLTLLDVTTTPQAIKSLGFVPYTTQDEVAEGAAMSIATVFGGWLPPYWGPAIMNHSGAALAASGNTVKYRGIFQTVL